MRLKLWWALCGDWWWDRLEGKVSEPCLERLSTAMENLQKPLCMVFGHLPVRDQCGLPEHDFCMCCQQSMPGAARRGVV